MKRDVAFKGNRVNLAGIFVDKGQGAPNFTVISQSMEETTLKKFNGKIKVITTFPSLDTPVCDLQVKQFNKEAADFADDTAVIGLSMDLPFAQKRFCEMNGIEKVSVMSDYKYHSMALNYGLFVKELGLMARSIIIIDKNNNVRYMQLVPEITHSPDYSSAIGALEKITKEQPAEIEDAEQYDFSSNNWQETGDCIKKSVRFQNRADLILYTHILGSISISKEINFTADSRERSATISIQSGCNPNIPARIDRIRI